MPLRPVKPVKRKVRRKPSRKAMASALARKSGSY